MQVTFTVPGNPVGKERPRFYRGHALTPKKTNEYENMVAMLYGMAADGVFFSDGEALRIVITAYLPIPSRATKAQRAGMLSGEMHAVKKPDADNIAKIIMDALNGVAFVDDTQVVDLLVRKLYGAEPCVRVSVENI